MNKKGYNYFEWLQKEKEIIANHLNVDVNDEDALIPFQYFTGCQYIYDYDAFKPYEQHLISRGYKFISTELDEDGNTDYIYQTEPPFKYNYVTINPDGSRTKEPIYGDVDTFVITKLKTPQNISLATIYKDKNHIKYKLGDIFPESEYSYLLRLRELVNKERYLTPFCKWDIPKWETRK